MADGREVKLKIKVDDADVVKGEASIKRLKKATDDLGKPASSSGNNGLTQQEKLARFMESNMPKAAATASNAMTQVDTATSTVTKGMGGLASAGGPVVIALAAVALVIVAVIAAAIELAKEVFALSKAFADYATEIRKISEETGLTSQTVSALKHEFDSQGRSISDLNAPLTNFRKLIGEAAAGSVDAKVKLASLGIDGKKAINDIDGAFKTAVATIVKAPTAMEQVKLAFNAFYSDGYKIIPFLREFHGNVDLAVDKARELGIMLSGEDVRAAQVFQRNYTDLEQTIQGLKNTFARDFLPTVSKAIKDLTGWLAENKETILGWAKTLGNALKSVIDWWERSAASIRSYNVELKYQNELQQAGEYGRRPVAAVPTGPLAPALPNYDPKLNGGMPNLGASDPAALEAQRAQEEQRRKAEIEQNKNDWDAAIKSWELSGTMAQKVLSDTFAKLKEQFTQTGDSNVFFENTKVALQQYVDQYGDSLQKLDALEDEKAKRDKQSDIQMTVLHQQQALRRQQYDEITQKTAKESTDLRIAASKKNTAEQLAEAETTVRKKNQLDDDALQHFIQNKNFLLDHAKITEKEYLQLVNQGEVSNLEAHKAQLQEFLKLDGLSAKKRTETNAEIAKIEQDITQKRVDGIHLETEAERQRRLVLQDIAKLEADNADSATVSQRRTDLANAQKDDLKHQLTQLNDLLANGGVNDGLVIEAAHLQDVLELRNRELNAVIAVNRAQLELANSMRVSNNEIRAGVYEHLAQQKSISASIADGINKTYDTITGKLDGQIDKMFKWSKGYLSFITEPLKAIAHNSVSKLFSGVVDRIFPGLGLGSKMTETNNPVARPIVDKLDEIHTTLKGLGGIGGGSAFSGGSGGSDLGSIIGRLRAFAGGGGSFGSGGGIGGTPNFNGQQDLWSSGGFGNASGPSRGGANSIGLGNVGSVASGGPGGFFSKIFGGASGLAGMLPFLGLGLGSRAGGGGGLSGILGGLGGLALGGAAFAGLGGLGALVSAGAISAGTSAAAFALLTNPFTIAAGAALIIGGILLKRNKQRRKDETTRNQGTLDALDALKQFDGLITNVRQGGDPAAAIAQGTTLGQQVREQYLQMANGLKDKKTRNIALADVSRIDSTIAQKMAELKAVAEIAQGAADRSKRILPEFAGGVFISQGFRDFQRYNGMLGGSWTGKDYRRALLADAEMVLNPNQQNRVRAIAGFDVFSGAGIPNYPNTTRSVGMAGGGIASGQSLALAAEAPNIILQPSFVLELSGVSLDDKVEAFLTSDTGIRTQIQVNKKLKKSGDI